MVSLYDVDGLEGPAHHPEHLQRKRVPGMEFVGKRSNPVGIPVYGGSYHPTSYGSELADEIAPNSRVILKRAPGMEFVGKRAKMSGKSAYMNLHEDMKY